MKSFRFFLGMASAAALLTLGACSEKEETTPDDNGNNNGGDEAYYAANATVGSSDSAFTATDAGGTVRFAAEGGSVVVNVSCGTAWTVENHMTDIFPTTVDTAAGTLTVSASQNTEEQDLTADITLMTAAQGIQFATISIVQEAYGAPEITVESTDVNFPAVGALSAEIGVECSLDDYDVQSGETWLSAEKTAAGISLTAEGNEYKEARSAQVVITASDGIRTAQATVNVTQEARAYIDLSSSIVAIGPDGGSKTVTVESNYDWTYSYDNVDWLSVQANGNALTFTAGQYDSEGSRSAVILFHTDGDGAENYCETTLTVTQTASAEMILTYKTTSADMTVTLPLSGAVDCIVDWGDGSSDAVTWTYPSHTYSAAGTYDVAISGIVTALNSNNAAVATSSSYNTTLTAVKQWGLTGLVDMAYAFIYNGALTSIPADTDGSFADVTTFSRAFAYCTAITRVPEGLFTYASNSTDFSMCFRDCSSLASIPDGLFAGCSACTTFYCVFYNDRVLRNIPADLFSGDTEVTDMSYAFYYCKLVSSIPEGLFKDCGKVTTFKDTFYECTTLTTVPTGIFDNCPEVTDFTSTFKWCTGLTSLPAALFAKNTKAQTFIGCFDHGNKITTLPSDLFENCTEATDFTEIFEYCTSLTSVPTGLFDSCTSAQTFDHTFAYDSKITSIPDGLFDHCTKVTSFHALCYGNTLLEKIPDGLFDHCPDVETFMYVFRICTTLTAIPNALFDNNRKVTNFRASFADCTNLEGESPFTVLNVDGEDVKVHLYQREYYPDEFTTPTEYINCFSFCEKLSDYDDIPIGWLYEGLQWSVSDAGDEGSGRDEPEIPAV